MQLNTTFHLNTAEVVKHSDTNKLTLLCYFTKKKKKILCLVYVYYYFNLQANIMHSSMKDITKYEKGGKI